MTYVLQGEDLLYLDRVNIRGINLCIYRGNYYHFYMIFYTNIYFKKCFGMKSDLPDIIIF